MADLPARSVIAAEYLEPEQDGQVRVLLTCDCGTVTDLTIKIEGALNGSGEGAYTCDGCGTSHWFTRHVEGGTECLTNRT